MTHRSAVAVVMRLAAAVTVAAMLAGAAPTPASAQGPQDGLVAHPHVYSVQFENPYVRLIRVRLPGYAQLSDHTHPPGIMLHVYFNDADPVQFNHDGPPNDVTRPPVRARSYRVGRATPETHSVVNTGAGLSDYMRVELKTEGEEGLLRRIPAMPLADTNATVVDMSNPQYRSSRVNVAPGQSMELTAPASQPFLLLALSNGIGVEQAGAPTATLQTGNERFVDAAQQVTVRNAGSAPVQLLRVDFVSKPAKP